MMTNEMNSEPTPEASTDCLVVVGSDKPMENRAQARVTTRLSALADWIRANGHRVPTRRELLAVLRGLGIKTSLGTIQNDLAALGLDDQQRWPRQFVHVTPNPRTKIPAGKSPSTTNEQRYA